MAQDKRIAWTGKRITGWWAVEGESIKERCEMEDNERNSAEYEERELVKRWLKEIAPAFDSDPAEIELLFSEDCPEALKPEMLMIAGNWEWFVARSNEWQDRNAATTRTESELFTI